MSWRSSPRGFLDTGGGDLGVGAVAIMPPWGCRRWAWSSVLVPITRLLCALGLAAGLSWVFWGDRKDGPVLRLECLCGEILAYVACHYLVAARAKLTVQLGDE